MKTSALNRTKATIVKRRYCRLASNINAMFASVAVLVAVFNPHLAEGVAITGVIADFGTRMLLKAFV